MSLSDIILIIISSAGLLHGITFAGYLSFFKKKKTLANYLLAFILVFMAFRIGKSVLLNFGDDLEPLFIFIGLAFLLLIGPLLRWYVRGMTKAQYKLGPYYWIELVPFALVFILSFFVTRTWFETNNKEVVIVFASLLIFIYLHFAFYILLSGLIIKDCKNKFPKKQRTKSQNEILAWLNLLIIGFVVIWISFFMNIIEDTIPYIIGPVMYSAVVYFLSFKAFQLKITDTNGDAFRKNEDDILFRKLTSLIEQDRLFLNSDISLSGLSKLVGKTSQKTSELINQYAGKNFNDYINQFRILEAKKLLSSQEGKNYTISSIAFDSGFSSLSSFNTAFKKFVGMTPSAYRKTLGA